MGRIGKLAGMLGRLLRLFFYIWICLVGYAIIMGGSEIGSNLSEPANYVVGYGSMAFGVIIILNGISGVLIALGIFSSNEDKEQKQNEETVDKNLKDDNTSRDIEYDGPKKSRENGLFTRPKVFKKSDQICKTCKSPISKGSYCLECQRKMSYLSNRPPPYRPWG
jgi:hypothetical protein